MRTLAAVELVSRLQEASERMVGAGQKILPNSTSSPGLGGLSQAQHFVCIKLQRKRISARQQQRIIIAR